MISWGPRRVPGESVTRDVILLLRGSRDWSSAGIVEVELRSESTATLPPAAAGLSSALESRRPVLDEDDRGGFLLGLAGRSIDEDPLPVARDVELAAGRVLGPNLEEDLRGSRFEL